MYNKIVFHPYKNGLGGLSLIKEKLVELGVRVLEVKKHNSNYRPRRNHLQIQWGVPHGGKRNQLLSFNEHGVPCGEYTSSMEQMVQWISEGSRVLCRTILNGHGGAGIVVASTVEELVDCPLAVKYVPKQREFRVHVVQVGHEQYQYKVREKRRRDGWQQLEGFNKYVRNHDNGWVFCDEFRDDLPADLLRISTNAVTALGLSLGAVDIGYHAAHGYCVYEVNTAPGCDNATAMFYAEAFKVRMENGN